MPSLVGKAVCQHHQTLQVYNKNHKDNDKDDDNDNGKNQMQKPTISLADQTQKPNTMISDEEEEMTKGCLNQKLSHLLFP